MINCLYHKILLPDCNCMITNHRIMNYQSHWRESQNISTSYSTTPYLNGGTITFKWVTLKLLIFFRFGSTEAYSKWIHYQFMTLVSSFLAHQNKRKGWNPRYKKVACNMLRYYFWSMESYDYPQYKCHRALTILQKSGLSWLMCGWSLVVAFSWNKVT